MEVYFTKEEAWAERGDEQSIPVKRDYSYKFTRRWFKNRNQITFSTFLARKFDGSNPVNLLQIGVFEGMDVVWQFQNTLRHPESRCLAVDPWLPNKKHNMEEVYERAKHNLRPFRKQLHIERDKSQNLLPRLIEKPAVIGEKPIHAGEWDLIIIDGDHNAPVVYMDAANSYELLRIGGWMVFDDVRNKHEKRNHVADGIEDFLLDYDQQVELEWFHRHCNCYRKTK